MSTRTLLLVAALSVVLPATSAPAVGQEARAADEGPGAEASVDSAAGLRTALERPPAEPPFDVVDAVALPFRIAVFPVNLVGDGIAFVLDEFTVPRPPGLVVRTYRDVVRWGLVPGVTTAVGSRSSPGVDVRFVRYAPFFVEAGYSLRRSAVSRAGVEVHGVRSRMGLTAAYTRDAAPKFWGVGPETPAGEESVYSRERILVSVDGRYRASTALVVEGRAGYEANEVGRGVDDGLPDAEDTFGEGAFFGLDAPTRFWWATAGATLDLTRTRGFQRTGLLVRAGATRFVGAGSTGAGFHRFEGEARAYLSPNPRQQLALRGLVEANRGDSGAGVPFFHLAALGDDRGARAFPENRFRDRDMAAVTAEWRYEIWRELQDRLRVESFLFVDHGAAVPSLTDAAGRDFHTSYGFGWRIVDPHVGPWAWTHVAFGGDDLRLRVGFGTVF